MRWLIAALCILFAIHAQADITHTTWFNNPNTGSGRDNRIAKFSTDGSQEDFHDSTIVQWPAGTNNFYRYSEMYGCNNYIVNVTGHFCGIGVWYSTDLGADGGPGWRRLGSLIDPATYDSKCGPTVGGADSGGCWSVRVVHNAANNNWVVWMHTGYGTQQPLVFVCTPSGTGPPVPGNANCVEQGQATGLTCAGVHAGDMMHIFVDDDGSAYLSYTCTGDYLMRIDKLNSTYTDSSGSTVVTLPAVTGEGESLIKNGSTYYMLYGSEPCPYCASTTLGYATASTPLGTWTDHGQISADNCGGQNEGQSTVTIGGTTYYFLHEDLWAQYAGYSQGTAIETILPITFTGGVPSISCASSWTITNANIAAGPLTPALVPIPELADESSNFTPYCNLTSATQIFQTFVAPFTASSFYVRLPTSQDGLADGPLNIDLITLDGSNNPASQLATTTILTNGKQNRLTPFVVELNGAITSGSTYGLRLRGANTAGCWAWAWNDNLPYASGIMRFSLDGGATWSTQTNRSIRFAVSKTSHGLSSAGTAVH